MRSRAGCIHGRRRRAAALATTLAAAAGVAAAVAIPGAQAHATAQVHATSHATHATTAAPGVMDMSTSERRWIRRTIAGMTLDEKVGQLFEINGFGDSVNDTSSAMEALNEKYYGVKTIAQLIRRYHPGGVIYFDWSNGLTSPQQVGRLSTGVQQTALSQGARLPVVISTDQEGGEVLRVLNHTTIFPGNMPLGATRNLGEAYGAGRVSGVELRAMGINVANAPVVDSNIDPLNETDGIRAYGDRPGLVSAMGVAQIVGEQTDQSSTGVGATAKHWPGFGDAPTDSDTGIAVSQQTMAQVRSENEPSFRAAIRAGVDRIMVTHILFPKITGSRIPSSLSPYWVDGVLRGQLHYNGPVVTDALDATAVQKFSASQVALMAINAGDDELIELANSAANDKAPADLVSAYPAVLSAVRSGRISSARLDLSLTRILAMKWRLGLIRHPIPDTARIPHVVDTPAENALAQRIADNSITLLRNDAHVLPLHLASGGKVLLTGFGLTGYGPPTFPTFAADLAAHGVASESVNTGAAPTTAQIAAAVAAARTSKLVVVNTFNAWSAPSQLTLVDDLIATGTPVVVAEVGTPYDVAYLPKAQTVIAGYGFLPSTLEALTRVMFGAQQPTGRLPVTITDPPPSTTVLYPFGFGLSLPSGS